ncbi:helix-turn-helix transcriptional regulator [Agromyces sp. NPDC055520]
MRSAESDPRADVAALAVASPPKMRVLEALQRVGHAVDARELADALGVHVTTARFHLDKLVEAGVVVAAAEHSSRRGRPRLRYALVDVVATRARDERSREQLIEVLAVALDGQASETRARLAREAGRRWAENLAGDDAAMRDDTATDRLTRMLDELGFAPEPVAEGLSLHACPFRDSARRHRDVICGVHAGLIGEVLAGAELLPFTAPDRCLVALGAPH